MVVVDNASTDGTARLLAECYPSVRVVRSPTNTGFAGGVVQGLAFVRTPYAVLVNNDATVRPGWLAALTAPFRDPAVGAVCSKLLLPDGRINSAGGWLAPDGYARDIGFGDPDEGQWDAPATVAFGCGAAVALRMAAVLEVGGMDPRFFLYYEDVDLSWRLRLAGWSVRYEPTAVVVHQHSATAGAGSLRHTYYTERNRLAMLVTCATAARAWNAVLRFPLTTVSVALGESRPKALRRVRAYLSFLAWLPALLRRRRQVLQRVSRRELELSLLGRPAPANR